MPNLTNKQRKFLQHLIDEHNCVGMYGAIKEALSSGKYKTVLMHQVVNNYNCLLEELHTGQNSHEYCHIGTYNKPTKYLK